MDYTDHIMLAALDAVNEIWGQEQMAPEEMLEILQAELETQFWDAWKSAEEGAA